MYINLNIGRENNFPNVYRTNQTQSTDGVETKNSMKSEQKDSVRISPMGRKNSMIESFMKQKQNIMEQREKLKSNTLEKGGTLDSIKNQLESFDEQIKNIDQQIAKSMAEQSKKQEEEKRMDIYSKPKTKEEVEGERLTNIVSNSSDLRQAKVISSVKKKVDSESRILKAEIKTGYGPIESKKAQVKELDQQSANLASQVSEKLTKLTENITENQQSQVIPEDTDKEDKSGVTNNTKENKSKLEEVEYDAKY